jgi:transcriptional regulator with XRE-family HTH domain
LLFDSLEAMSEAWNQETAKRFFARACPLLFGLGAIAYWSLIAARHSPALRREIEGITQCVLAVGDGRLRIAKAEGRPLGIEGSVYRHGLENGRPVLAAAPAAARLGAALRALRSSRRLSQRDLAHLAGVSPSAISQAERGRGGLSLETLLDLAGKLNITLEDLLRGVVRLSRGAAATPDFAHKGVEVVTVAAGLVQVLLESGRPVLRRGEALIADTTAVAGWRNLSDREATVFWVLHDA